MAYFGGKGGSGVYQSIINQIPPHQIYIESFLGGGSVMKYKRAAKLNIGFDLDNEALIEYKKSSDIPNLHLINQSAFDLFQYNSLSPFNDDVFIYCDPPYLKSTRTSRHRYKYELTDDQHAELLHNLKKFDCFVAISTYPNELYESELKDWRVVEYKTVTRGGKQVAEHLYCNYPEPEILHDYSYFGKTFRQREAFQRKVNRHVKKFENMSRVERLGILMAIFKEVEGIDFIDRLSA